MPTYQYECTHCGHDFEALQSMTDKKLKKCPQCGKNGLERLIGSGTGIIFKGSGFYETDYKKKDSRHFAESSGRDPDRLNKGVSEPPKTESAKKPADRPTAGSCHGGSGACACLRR